jgi:peptide/nickel transport system substrate-binding protein
MAFHRNLLRAALAVILLAIGANAAEARDLRIGISQFPSNLHPLIDSMLAKTYTIVMGTRPLTNHDAQWELRCEVCTELPTLENGKAVIEPLDGGGEGVAITYEIKPDLFWGDGVPVTTEDFVFSWEVGRHPESGAAGAEGFRRILAIDALDDKRFVVHVDRVTYQYNVANSFYPLPAHIERPIFEASPIDYRNRSAYETDSTNPGLFFGPYVISEVVPGSQISLVRNPEWRGREPAFERVILRTIENTSALEANLLSGEVDLIDGDLGLSIDQAIAFEERHGDRFNVIFKPGLIYEHLDVLLDNPILADKRVREALILSADRQALSEQLFGGRQPVAHSNVSPLDWVYDETVPVYAYDPNAAAALLDEAGWSEMKGGIRHNAAGEPLRLRLMTTAGNRTRELVQQVLQAGWKQIGIEVEIRNEPPRVFFGETVTKRDYGALALFAWLSAPEAVPLTTLRSDQVPSEENAWSGQNYTGYANPEMDHLIDAIERELDREKRKQLWSELQHLYAEDLPAIPLYWRASSYILPKQLKGVEPTGHRATTTQRIEDWTWEE